MPPGFPRGLAWPPDGDERCTRCSCIHPSTRARCSTRILGPDASALTWRPAVVAGHALAADAHGIRVALVAAAGASVAGRLTALSPEARARLDFAMAALGAGRRAVTADGGSVETEGYVFAPEDAPGGEWNPGRGAEERGRLEETLVEAMGHYGRRAPAEMPLLLHGIAIRALARVRGPRTEAPVSLRRRARRRRCRAGRRSFAYARYFGDRGAPAAPPALRRGDVGAARAGGVHQRRRGDGAAVRPAAAGRCC